MVLQADVCPGPQAEITAAPQLTGDSRPEKAEEHLSTLLAHSANGFLLPPSVHCGNDNSSHTLQARREPEMRRADKCTGEAAAPPNAQAGCSAPSLLLCKLGLRPDYTLFELISWKPHTKVLT